MDMQSKPAALNGIPGAIVGLSSNGTLWQGEVGTEVLLGFLRDGTVGTTLELRSESGVTHARVHRCWVDASPPTWRLRVVLEEHAVA